jgi:hypothetical protein
MVDRKVMRRCRWKVGKLRRLTESVERLRR